MPPLAVGNSHATLHLVDNVAGVVVDVEGAKFVGSQEALVLGTAVITDESVDGFHFECLDIRYSATNQRHGKADVTGELVIKNLEPWGLVSFFSPVLPGTDGPAIQIRMISCGLFGKLKY